MQVTRQFNPRSHCINYSKRMKENSSIFLTFLKHPMPSCDINPITLKIDPTPLSAIFYSEIHEWVELMNKKLPSFSQLEFKTENERLEYYSELLQIIRTQKEKVLLMLKEIIGPWICLFRGGAKSREFQKNDDVLYDKIHEICEDSFSRQQQFLFYRLARCVDILTDPEINRGICAIRNLEKTQKSSEVVDIQAFILDHKSQMSAEMTTNDIDYYPTILIIDEFLDYIPWEYLIPNQEITRLFSFGILCKLYETHKANIKNGYLMNQVTTGGFLINPDLNLNEMEKRMKLFATYWAPNFEIISGRKPTPDEMEAFLKRNDVIL